MKQPDSIITTGFTSPCGVLALGDLNGRLCLCDWNVPHRRESVDSLLCRRLNASMTDGMTPLLRQAVAELSEYFSGTRNKFSIPLLQAGTPFQLSVWNELAQVAYGHTASYASVAQAIGRPKAVRAVANAVAANPLSIFVPCHRVVGSDTSLTGYAGGLDAKKFLLNLELFKINH